MEVYETERGIYMSREVDMLQQDIEAYSKENIYDWDNSVMLNYYPKRIMELLGTEFEKKSCLELGVGHGYTARLFSRSFNTYTVIEGSREVIRKFKEENKDLNIEVINSFFEDWSANGQKYDVIILGFVLEHVDNPVEILKQYKEYLNVNGRIFIAVPNAEALNRRVGLAVGLLKDIEELSQNDVMFGHKRYYRLESLRYDVNQAGLHILREEGIFMKVMSTKQMVTLKISDDIMRGYLEIAKGYPELSCALLMEASL